MVAAQNMHKAIGQDTSEPFQIDNGYGGTRVSDVHIQDITNSNTQWVKNGDNIEVSAGITGASDLTREDITADLSGFGRGTVIADSFDGFTATWTIYNVVCTPNDGPITVTVNVEDNSNSATITADNTDPEINIINPENGLYMFNKKFLPLAKTIIVGPITIELDVEDTSGVYKVEFYIDDQLETLVNEEPFDWYMNIKQRGKRNLEIIVYDQAGNKDIESTMITVFNLFGN